MAQFDDVARREIASNAATVREASVEIARQMSILWEARLNMAMAADDDEGVRRMLGEASAEQYIDNCNCAIPSASVEQPGTAKPPLR
ncbi:hypothetical protein FHR33_009739 [Nonomuraea dietziae]|uniref:Uncharacterized protein n=1 Tax=Nonomuraea dietziae TaxID=65515 RepID=A0A7W5VAR0_9ACTN|nr:hypothetical protein [Nonomuraea dietziae]